MNYSRDDIDNILRTNDRAVEVGIIRLFELQTQDEQATADTKHDNMKGFSCTDAKAGTNFARWLLGMDHTNTVKFPRKSLKHERADRHFWRYRKNGESTLDRARRICLKHSRQLTALANGELEVLNAHAA